VQVPDPVDLQNRANCAQVAASPRTFKHNFNHISIHRLLAEKGPVKPKKKVVHRL